MTCGELRAYLSYLSNFVLDASQTHVAYLDSNSNLWLATAPSYTPQQVSALGNLQAFPVFSPDGSTLFEADFTADSTHVFEALNAASVTGESGRLPNAPQVTLVGYDIATRTTTASISNSVLWSPAAATGSLLVFYDNPRTTSTPGQLLCDLRDVDLRAASPTSKLLQADVQCGGKTGFALEPIVPTLTADGRTVVYACQGTAFQPGIYASTLPKVESGRLLRPVHGRHRRVP